MIRLVKHGSKSDAYVEKEKKSLNELKGFQLERRLEVYVVSIVLCYHKLLQLETCIETVDSCGDSGEGIDLGS